MITRSAAAVLSASLALGACSTVHVPRLGMRCQDISFPIYFAQGSDAVTPIAGQAIGQAAQKAAGCHVGEVHITGLADASGNAQANLDLSRRRAANVAAVLAMDGLPAPTFDLNAQGDTGATGPDGKAQLMQRRTDVSIHFVR